MQLQFSGHQSEEFVVAPEALSSVAQRVGICGRLRGRGIPEAVVQRHRVCTAAPASRHVAKPTTWCSSTCCSCPPRGGTCWRANSSKPAACRHRHDCRPSYHCHRDRYVDAATLCASDSGTGSGLWFACARVCVGLSGAPAICYAAPRPHLLHAHIDTVSACLQAQLCSAQYADSCANGGRRAGIEAPRRSLGLDGWPGRGPEP